MEYIEKNPQAPEKKGTVLSIISVKGGVGKTTLAVNLSMVLCKELKKRCLLVDGDLNLPNISFHLNLTDPDVALHDVLRGEYSIQQAVDVHESGLHVVLGSISQEGVNSEAIKSALNLISLQYDWVILDTSPCLDENLRNMMSASDEILLVSSPDLPSILACLKAVKYASDLGVKIRGLVLNRVHSRGMDLTVQGIEQTLGLTVLASVPEDLKVYEAFMNRKPVVLHAPNTPASKALRRLAYKLAGRDPPPEDFLSRVANYLRALLRI